MLLTLHNRARFHLTFFAWTIATVMKYCLLACLTQTFDLYLHFFVLFLILLLSLLSSLYSFASPHSTNISRRMNMNFTRNIATNKSLIFLLPSILGSYRNYWFRGASMLDTLDDKKSMPSSECFAF